MNVDFFGSDVRVIEKIDNAIDVKRVIVEQHAVNKELLSYCLLRQVEVCPVNHVSELAELNDHGDCDLGVSCGCGLIFKNMHIERYPHGILNIHPGALPDNRGRHPISWALINNEWHCGVSFHMITEKIDQGLLVHSFAIKRSIFDGASDIEEKFISRLDSEFPVAIENILSNKGTMLEEGSYFPPIGTSLKRLNPSEHSAEYLLNVVRSQAPHGGIDFGMGKNVTEAYVRGNSDEPGYMNMVSSDNIVLLVK